MEINCTKNEQKFDNFYKLINKGIDEIYNKTKEEIAPLNDQNPQNENVDMNKEDITSKLNIKYILDDLKKQFFSINYYGLLQKLFISYIFKNIDIFIEQISNNHYLGEFIINNLIKTFPKIEEYEEIKNFSNVGQIKDLINSTNDMINSLKDINNQGQTISNSTYEKLDEQKIQWRKIFENKEINNITINQNISKNELSKNFNDLIASTNKNNLDSFNNFLDQKNNLNNIVPDWNLLRNILNEENNYSNNQYPNTGNDLDSFNFNNLNKGNNIINNQKNLDLLNESNSFLNKDDKINQNFINKSLNNSINNNEYNFNTNNLNLNANRPFDYLNAKNLTNNKPINLMNSMENNNRILMNYPNLQNIQNPNNFINRYNMINNNHLNKIPQYGIQGININNTPNKTNSNVNLLNGQITSQNIPNLTTEQFNIQQDNPITNTNNANVGQYTKKLNLQNSLFNEYCNLSMLSGNSNPNASINSVNLNKANLLGNIIPNVPRNQNVNPMFQQNLNTLNPNLNQPSSFGQNQGLYEQLQMLQQQNQLLNLGNSLNPLQQQQQQINMNIANRFNGQIGFNVNTQSQINNLMGGNQIV